MGLVTVLDLQASGQKVGVDELGGYHLRTLRTGHREALRMSGVGGIDSAILPRPKTATQALPCIPTAPRVGSSSVGPGPAGRAITMMDSP